jgi:hypothetical protein
MIIKSVEKLQNLLINSRGIFIRLFLKHKENFINIYILKIQLIDHMDYENIYLSFWEYFLKNKF